MDGGGAGVVLCGPRCACAAAACCPRAPPHAAPVHLRLTQAKGWTLHASVAAPPGALLASFGGDLVPRPAARARLAAADAANGPCFVVIVREVAAGGVTIAHARDTAARGGVARFASHACGDAATAIGCVVRTTGCPWPDVVLIAGARGVAAGEEVTWGYGAGGGAARWCSTKWAMHSR